MTEEPIIVAARFLQSQLEWLRHAVADGNGEPYAVRAFAEIDHCAGRLRGLVNGPSEQKYLGPCGADMEDFGVGMDGDLIPAGIIPCEGDVYGVRGAQRGRCRSCGAEVAQDDRAAWLDGEVRAHAFRASQIAEAYRVNVNTIRSWAARGALASYWRTSAGLVTPWIDPPLDPNLKGEAMEKRLGEISDEIQARGGRLHYVGDVLDLAAADAARRAGEQSKRARRAAARAAETEDAA